MANRIIFLSTALQTDAIAARAAACSIRRLARKCNPANEMMFRAIFVHLLLLTLLATAGSLTNRSVAAPKNGNGLVFHHSDCGFPYVRMYENGGDSRGSRCGNWIPFFAEQVVHWNGDHNWTIEELEERTGKVVTVLGKGAPPNGHGAVYNKSDCGYPNVRWYSDGGNGPGSRCGCGRWSLTDAQCAKVWSNGRRNWSQCELGTTNCKIGQAVVNGAKFIAAEVREHLALVCKKTLGPVLNQLIGRSCTLAGTQFEVECNATLDAEEGPAGAAACTSAGVALVAECKADGKFTVKAIDPLLEKICDRI